jgi:Squalene/phytoene synthase
MTADMLKQLRDMDRVRYLTCLFAPDNKQTALASLYVFNAEIERIRDVVSDPQIGLIRQQWWRDTVEAIYADGAVDHPVAIGLAKAIQDHQLPKAPLIGLINAREFDLFADPMPTRTSLEAYFGETESAVMQLACIILDPVAASSSAITSGLAGVARGLARHLAEPERMPNLTPADETRESLLILARKRWKELVTLHIPSTVFPAYLSTASVPRQLARLNRTTVKTAGVSPVLRQWDMWRLARRGKLLPS